MVDSIDDISIEGASIGLTRYKIIFIGDVAVGKTSIINRFIENRFRDAYEPSIGVDFCSKNIRHKGRNIKLQIWDSAGQERYKSLIPTYVRGSSIIFIVYDISKKETFNSVPSWINFVKNIENAIIVLVGNKSDIEERKVEIAEGELLANKEGLQFFEISAKTNHNVRKMFFSVVAELPIFEDLNEVKAKLINDLEDENNESRVETTTQNDEYIQTHLQMTNKKLSNNTKASKCRC